MSENLNLLARNAPVLHNHSVPDAIAYNLLLRADLVQHIRSVIAKLGVTQLEAATRAGITPPRMSDLMSGRIQKFTLDAMVNVSEKLGYSVSLTFQNLDS